MMNSDPQILLVEDDPNFGAVLKSYLEINDFQVEWVQDGAMAFYTYKTVRCDLVILDIMLPHIDGFEIARQIREHNPTVPLIFLTAKKLKSDVLEGFRIGADDYIIKPFDSEVLIFKIKAILRRKDKEVPDETGILDIGNLRFNYHERLISGGTDEKRLSPKEAELLLMLIQNKNGVLKREDALNQIWGEESYFTTRSMDVFITKLRKYLSDDPSVEIMTIHGTGFRLKCGKEQEKG